MKHLTKNIVILFAFLCIPLAAKHGRREISPRQTTLLSPAQSTHLPEGTVRELIQIDGARQPGFYVLKTIHHAKGWFKCDMHGTIIKKLKFES